MVEMFSRAFSDKKVKLWKEEKSWNAITGFFWQKSKIVEIIEKREIGNCKNVISGFFWQKGENSSTSCLQLPPREIDENTL